MPRAMASFRSSSSSRRSPPGSSPDPRAADAHHLSVPAWRLDASHLQHAVSLGLRRQCRGCLRPLSAFLIFYLLCGIAGGACAHRSCSRSRRAARSAHRAPCRACSPPISCSIPRARVWILLFMRIPLRISAVLGAGRLVRVAARQRFHGQRRTRSQVAWWAHIGGFLAGLILTFVLRSRLLVRTALSPDGRELAVRLVATSQAAWLCRLSDVDLQGLRSLGSGRDLCTAARGRRSYEEFP